jgi:hypothetical protein
MVHQYVNQEDKISGLERKYNEYKSKINSNTEKDTHELYQTSLKFLEEKKQNKPLKIELNPNQRFIDSFNQRVINERKSQEQKELLSEFDSNGNRLACVWKNKSFVQTYDSIGLFAKKGNYEELAWKVFRDLEDNNIFMKVLYFPRLRKEDYLDLIHYYNDNTTKYRRNKILSYSLVLGSAALSWSLAYRNNFKFTSFVLLTGGSFFGIKYLVDRYLLNSLNSNLNKLSIPIAEKYPEIKYLSIEYVKSPQI